MGLCPLQILFSKELFVQKEEPPSAFLGLAIRLLCSHSTSWMLLHLPHLYFYVLLQMPVPINNTRHSVRSKHTPYSVCSPARLSPLSRPFHRWLPLASTYRRRFSHLTWASPCRPSLSALLPWLHP